jgi:hypothetical protein
MSHAPSVTTSHDTPATESGPGRTVASAPPSLEARDSRYAELGRSSSLTDWGVLAATGLFLLAAAYRAVPRRGR